jgi:hypothetical protein
MEPGTSSGRLPSRLPNKSGDSHHGHSYQIQVQYPQANVSSIKDVESIPLKSGEDSGPQIGDVAQVNYGTMVGEYDRYNLRRIISITANIDGDDLGKAAREVQEPGSRYSSKRMNVTLDRQQSRKNFQRCKRSVLAAWQSCSCLLIFPTTKISTGEVVPAILAGVVLSIKCRRYLTFSLLWAMAVGIGIANAILSESGGWAVLSGGCHT